MGNRKGISSDDFLFDNSKNAEIDMKFQQLKVTGATAISSDMMFGRASAPENAQPSLIQSFENNLLGRSSLNSGSSYDEYKEAANRVAEKVTQEASKLKAATMDWFSQFTSQQ